MVKLVARERFYYAGRNVEKDQEFEAEQQDVALLTNSISPRAKMPPPPEPPKPAPKAEAVEEAPKVVEQKQPEWRRRYQRRDLLPKE